MKNIVHIPQLIALWVVVTSFAAQAKISDEMKALSSNVSTGMQSQVMSQA